MTQRELSFVPVSASKSVKLSIIIVSWNVREDLVRCLRSIEDNHPLTPYEVIVVDNASSDGTMECLRRDFPAATVIENEQNRGFAAANNQGIQKAGGQYIFLLNPDTIVHSGSLDVLIRFMDNNPDAGACGPKLLDGIGKPCHWGGEFPTFRFALYSKTILRLLGIFRGHYKKVKKGTFYRDRQSEVSHLCGAALMVRRSVIEKIGSLDESFFMYYEDVDLCLRVVQTGARVFYVPEAMITHFGGGSSNQTSGKQHLMSYKSLLILFRKHRGNAATMLFALIFKPGVILKEIWNVFSGAIVYLVFAILQNPQKQAKSLTKAKRSANFLRRYTWQFLFRT
jgi:hypothetical protein